MSRIDNILSALEAGLAGVAPASRASALTSLRAAFLAHAPPPLYLDDPSTRAAYQAFFFPQSFAKTLSVLEELAGLTPRVVVDLGAGTGAMALAAWTRWPQATLHLVDTSAGALAEAKRLGRSVGAEVGTYAQDLATWPTDLGRADLILVGNALNELALDARVTLVRELLDRRLAPCGAVVLLEPAEREHARGLQTLRDALLPAGRAPVAPCPHAEPCPASVRPRDFCHQARAAAMPAWFETLRREVGLSDKRLRFSYLVYSQDAPVPTPGLVRIISHRLVEKGRIRYFGCSAAGLVEVMRQDRFKRPHNADFDVLGRGALVELPRAERVTKLGAEDVVRVIGEPDPWASARD